MKKINTLILLFFLLLVFSILININCKKAICTPESIFPTCSGNYNCSMEIDGVERTFWIYIPSSYDSTKKMPLLIGLHGGGGKAENFNKLTGFSELSEKEGFIALYPQGLEKQWNAGRSDSHMKHNEDDVLFISLLLDRLEENINIDTERIYAAGISNGGFMCYKLACQLPDKIAAIGAVASNMPELIYENDISNVPVSVLIMNGTRDPLVPWEGGPVSFFSIESDTYVLSTSDTADYWVDLNNCLKYPQVTWLEDKDESDGTIVKVEFYSSEKNDKEVIIYSIVEGGHTWPGGWQYLPEKIIGKTCKDINGSEIIWEFFKNQKL